MGNVSPRKSKSCHEGFSNHLNLTPNRSSWKKQLQIINDTLNIKRFSLRHTNGKTKRYRTTIDENNHHSLSTQNYHDLIKNNCEKTNKKLTKDDQQHSNVKKSFSLFSIKQPLTDITNKEQQPSTNNFVSHRRRSKIELTAGNKYFSFTKLQ
jgi:hypothetical protein